MTLCGVKHSTFKSYMSYKAITDKDSAQYKLIHSGQIVIGDDGLLYDGEYVGIALGSRFGPVGTKYIITLDNGNQFKAIKLDAKSDSHTVDRCHHISDGSIVEFVIDIQKASNVYQFAISSGDFNNIPKYCGEVVKIEQLEFPQ